MEDQNFNIFLAMIISNLMIISKYLRTSHLSPSNYFYKSCDNCGYLLHINRYVNFKINKCSQCNEEFDIFDLLYNNSQMYLSNQNQELALKYALLAYSTIKFSNQDKSFGLGEILLELGYTHLGEVCFLKSFQLGLIR